jgi:hypothetical protein
MADIYDVRLAVAAAIFAILSPEVQLGTCLDWTEAVLRGERKGGRYPNVQSQRIADALSTRYPVKRIGGPKCNPFYRAIMGDTNALVIDRWAQFAAGIPRNQVMGSKLRQEVEAAYRAVAKLYSETVRAFQAMLWILVRESTPKAGKMIVPKLTDITS